MNSSQTKINKKKWTFLLLPLVISLAAQLYITNSVAGEGQELARIDAQIVETARQNKVLREDIASANSLQKIESASVELGLVKPSSVVYAESNTAIGKAAGSTAYVDIRNNQ